MTKYAYILILASSLLFFMGLLMVYDTTSAQLIFSSNSSLYEPFIKQLLFGVVGIVIGLLVFFKGYERLIDLSPFFLLMTTILLILTFVPIIGVEINGAKRWIKFFSNFTFQPSELAKLVIPCYFIFRIINTKSSSHLPTFLWTLFFMAIPIGLILLEPDNGTTAFILASLVLLFFLTKVKWTYWVLPLSIFFASGVIVAMQMPHVKSRLMVYLHPELDLRGKGHQPYQAKIATGSGGLFGKGLGESLQKLNYLPQSRSDYIAAIYAEEFGFVGILILIALFMLIIFSGFSIATQATSLVAFFVASTMTFLISFQAFLNLGVVSGLLPSKGITLPFFSQGGTALIFNFIDIFFLLAVSKQTKQELLREKRI